MNKPLWIGVGIASVALAAYYIANQVKLAEKLCYKLVGYKIGTLSLQSTNLQLQLQIRNKGELAVKIKGYKINVFANGYYMATAHSNSVVGVEAHGTVDAIVNIDANPKMLVKNVFSILSTKESLKKTVFSFEGNLRISKGGIPFRIPISYSSTVNELTSGRNEEKPC